MAARLSRPLWHDRQQAGHALGRQFAGCGPIPERALLLGLPRGGVVVAAAMAAELQRPFRTWSVRKIADPSWPELAIGAIAGEDVSVWREGAMGPEQQRARRCGWLQQELLELRRRQRLYGDPQPQELRGRPLIVVDDGIATGMTVLVALEALRQVQPESLSLAVPVLDRQLLHRLTPLLDHLEALAVVEDLRAVGEWYEHFEPVPDAEVLRLLRANAEAVRDGAPGGRPHSD
jgi:putative phosphoribosyl transferase